MVLRRAGAASGESLWLWMMPSALLLTRMPPLALALLPLLALALL